MNNEFVKVLKKLKAVLLHAAVQMKQQRCTFEILWIPKQSCTVSGMVCVNDMQRMQLSVYRTNCIVRWVLCTENMFLNLEFNIFTLLYSFQSTQLYNKSIV